MSEAGTDGLRDASWVIVDASLSLAELRECCADVETLLRLNPLLEIDAWRPIGADGFHAEWRNLSNQRRLAVELRVQRESDDAFTLSYSDGIKASTRFALESTADGSRATITDDYSRLPAHERAQRIDEVDKSLAAWGWALRDHWRRQRRWGRFAAWRWFMRRCWLPLTPRTRRIATLLVLITAAELALVTVVALVYWIETR